MTDLVKELVFMQMIVANGVMMVQVLQDTGLLEQNVHQF